MPQLQLLASVSTRLLNKQRVTNYVADRWNYVGIDRYADTWYFIIGILFMAAVFAGLLWLTKRPRAKGLKKGSKIGLYVLIIMITLGAGWGSTHLMINHLGPSVNQEYSFSKSASHAYENHNLADTQVKEASDKQQARNDRTQLTRIQRAVSKHKIPRGQRKMAASQIRRYRDDSRTASFNVNEDRKDLRTHSVHPVKKPGLLKLFRL